MKKTVFILICLLFFFGFTHAQEARFETEVSNTNVSLGEPFRILFTISNASKISGFDPPAFDGFDVLQNSQSQSVSIINGNMSRKISHVFILKPTAIGRFTIAGATARIDGKQVHSNPVTITVEKGNASAGQNNPPSRNNRVQPAPASPSLPSRFRNHPAILRNGEDPMSKIKKNVFAKVEVDKKDVYVGQQITATYKLYTRLPTSSKVTKVPSFTGFSTHDLPVPNPPRPTIEDVNGEQYRVFTIRKTMLFPLQTGTQELDPVKIDNDVRLYTVEKSQGNNPFSDIFNDPFFRDAFNDPFFQQAFGGGMQLVPHQYNYQLSSPVVTIHVKPLPEEGKPKDFDGAVGEFHIKSAIDKTKLTTDGAVSFTVTISGKGNVNLLNAPVIDFPHSIESYDPKIKDNFHNTNPFGGSRSYTYVLMPKTTGDITIPAVSFSYFDPETKKYQTVQTQPHAIEVTPGKNESTTSSGTNYSNTLQPIRTGQLVWSRSGILWFGSWWHWLFMILPILILIAILIWKKRRDALLSDQVLLKNKKANRVALKRLSQARKYLRQNSSKSFYEEVSQAIWGYLCDKLSIPLAELTKQKAEDKLKQKDITGALPKSLFALLDRCEMALYAGVSGHEHMEETYTQAIKVISELENKLKK